MRSFLKSDYAGWLLPAPKEQQLRERRQGPKQTGRAKTCGYRVLRVGSTYYCGVQSGDLGTGKGQTLRVKLQMAVAATQVYCCVIRTDFPLTKVCVLGVSVLSLRRQQQEPPPYCAQGKKQPLLSFCLYLDSSEAPEAIYTFVKSWSRKEPAHVPLSSIKLFQVLNEISL